MINLTIVNDSNCIPSNNEWINSNDFPDIIDEKGQAVPSNFSGRCYKLIGKQDRKLSTFDRFKNIVQAIYLFILSIFKQIDSQKWKDLFTETHESRYFVKIIPPSIQMQQVGMTKDISLIFPEDLFNRSLLSFLDDEDIARCSEVNRVWNNLASKSDQALKNIPCIAFGKKKWAEYFGKNIGKQPPLPSDIQTILDAECPFYPPNKVRDTHTLALIPSTFNNKKITIELLEKLGKAPKKGKPSGFTSILEFPSLKIQEKATDQPYWILMLKKPTFVFNFPVEYDEVPHVIDVAIGFLVDYIPSQIRFNHIDEKMIYNLGVFPKLIKYTPEDWGRYSYTWGLTPIRKLNKSPLEESTNS